MQRFLIDSAEAQPAWQALQRDGVVVLNQGLPVALLERAQIHVASLLQAQTEADKQAHKSLGSLIKLWSDPFFCEFVLQPGIREFLEQMGARSLRFSNGYLFSKPPASPQTFWHQDWWMWDDAASYTDFIPQIGVLIYLQDTAVENGCLRILPGSHRKRHALHDEHRKLDNSALRRMDDPQAMPFQYAQGEIDVPVRRGDIVLLDARLLHAAHPNKSQLPRNLLTLWYFPNYAELSEGARARIGTTNIPQSWSKAQAQKLQPYLPVYNGNAAAHAVVDQPGSDLC